MKQYQGVIAQYPMAIRRRLKATVTIQAARIYRYRERATKSVNLGKIIAAKQE
ncbi:MAG: hypothetical protein ABIJ30_01440 [bacterium]